MTKHITSSYFTDEELTRSPTAERYALRNDPPHEAWTNLQALVRNVLDPAREALGLPIRVTSGYRSPAVNDKVGGAKDSQHTRGEAADITSRDNPRLLEVLKTLPHDQIVIYIDRRGLIRWLHVSFSRTRGNRGQILKKYIA